MDTIQVRGARTHNLKNIDLDIPRDKLIVITGLSGSGKSSLAFDTLYAEGQRRYVESLSTYARQFLSMMEKPDVDHVEGLSPAISIEQKSTSHNPRSTVGTITEIYDYLRLLFARAGEPRCPDHGQALNAQTVSQMVDQVLALPEGSKLMLLAPVIKDRKGEHLHLFDSLRRQGFIRARIDGLVCDLDEAPALDKKKKHTIEVVVDRFKVKEDIGLRLAESFETALALAEGLASISYMDGGTPDQIFSAKFACPVCNYSLNELEPRLFSFNNPAGACPTCDGLGVHQFFDIDRVIQHPEASISEGAIRGWDRRTLFYYNMLTSLAEHYDFDIEQPWEQLSPIHQQKILFGSDDEEITFNYVNDRGTVFRRQHSFEGVINNMERRYRETESTSVREELTKYMATSNCPECSGTRLRKSARNVFIDDRRIEDIVCMPVGDCCDYFEQLDLPGRQGEIAEKIVKEIRQRFNFLVDVGLNYLSLNRSADTLSGGEAQRIRLASQIGAGLVGVMYILDEPSIGLHQRDNERLLKTLVRLRDLGNTVIVVEHDEDAIASADHIIDIGPGAGIHGGEIVAEGTAKQIKANKNSITGQFMSGKRGIVIPKVRNKGKGKTLKITGATGNNLQKIDLEIPQGVFTCITGVSGSGKSTLINETLYPAAAVALNKATTLKPAAHTKITGLSHLDKCIDINQSPIGRTPRSNPATYTGIFTPVRELFAGTQEARSRGYNPGRFSFNVKGGRCEACQGDGVTKVEMHFLPDIYVPCDVCKGQRYNRETLDVHFKGKNIHQVLDMTIEDAREFFDAIPAIARKLQTLIDVGLSYISLGQSATTLSGGEAQRVKLSKELSKRDTGKTLYILDEPTTGLHFHDIEQLLAVLHRLRDHGNTVVVIEHNLDVIKTADWIVDLGPEGGSGGGLIVAQGTPEEVALVEGSHTGHFLKDILAR
ncbi:excinuclease ABC subunit UvrA [SAR92 clade bacterium H231]|jgi:excinuclease ABC subunit A|nr:excinuclease ABC subunit UvrA [Porticoccaceae bacterium]MCT2533881.1 excinuclease ABC subunit UvrA [SAR92 clade bacterium H231]MDA9565808.1 excinuclease ABC subunit UvrA [Porticoccaceae bacterium]MDB2547861.1 excinuclease ABC subunit UvrA [Porticoccaceae bacterium]MDG1200470.1 excinuclease ABC subunit UvrA [Porticoccaceae bacterium]